tara:strand:- start:1013 stop:2734 length:1722 start_codon:yes stop_codon:yes gene_type:complete
MINISKNDFLLLLSYFAITTILYVLPFIKLPLGYNTAWMFFVFSSDASLTLTHYYESAGIIPGNIIESVKSVSNFYGRASFLNLGQYWLLAKLFPELDIVWRLLPVTAMTISVFFWHKILSKFHLPYIILSIIIFFLITDPSSVWMDWNKAESIGFLFYTISCYCSFSNKNISYYLLVFCFLCSLFFKETFFIGLPLIILFRMYSADANKIDSIRIFIIKFIKNNIFLLSSSFGYVVFMTIFFLNIDLSNSYFLNLVEVSPEFVPFTIEYIKLQLPIYFGDLYFIYFPMIILLLGILLFDILFFSGKTTENYNLKWMIFLSYILTFIFYFFVLYEFGVVHRRYMIPVNIFNMMFVVFMFKFYRHHLKFDISIIVYTILCVPCIFWIYEFNVILSSLLLIFVLITIVLVKFFKLSKLRLELIKIIAFLFIIIPVTDQLIVNLAASRSELIQWKSVNRTIISNELKPESTLLLNLSKNFIIEHAISMEVNSVISGRDDIVFFVNTKNLPQDIKSNPFQLKEIERFNQGKTANLNENYEIYRIGNDNKKNKSLIDNIQNRYKTSTYDSFYKIKSND